MKAPKVQPCSRCLGCGKLARDEHGTPWSAWQEQRHPAEVRQRVGQFGPRRCPVCDGAGVVGLLYLQGLAVNLLEILPTEPIGLSLHELADGLLDDRSPIGLHKVAVAREQVAAALDGIYQHIGEDAFGRAGVALYGVQRVDRARVNEFFRRRGSRDGAPGSTGSVPRQEG